MQLYRLYIETKETKTSMLINKYEQLLFKHEYKFIIAYEQIKNQLRNEQIDTFSNNIPGQDDHFFIEIFNSYINIENVMPDSFDSALENAFKNVRKKYEKNDFKKDLKKYFFTQDNETIIKSLAEYNAYNDAYSYFVDKKDKLKTIFNKRRDPNAQNLIIHLAEIKELISKHLSFFNLKYEKKQILSNEQVEKLKNNFEVLLIKCEVLKLEKKILHILPFNYLISAPFYELFLELKPYKKHIPHMRGLIISFICSHFEQSQETTLKKKFGKKEEIKRFNQFKTKIEKNNVE